MLSTHRPHPHSLSPLSPLLALLALGGLAGAQDLSWETFGSGADLFGGSLQRLGDVNGDTFDDILVGAPGDATGGSYAGAAYVLSGADGSPLAAFHGPDPASYLGASVGAAGDVDADGHPDIVVGAPGDYRMGNPPGRAFVYSGLDGHLIGTLLERNPSEQFGVEVSGVGDVDLDGHADVAVTAPRRSTLRGGVTVFSGRTGAVLWEAVGEQPLDYFGSALCRVGDVNGDGIDDLFIGATSGYARMHSGLDGTILYTSRRGFASDRYGSSLGVIGDLGYDGVPEILVGAPAGNLNGEVYVLDGKRGDLLYVLEGGFTFEGFGTSVSGAGDLNGDGQEDWLVGAPGYAYPDGGRGSVYAFSGVNGNLLFTWRGGPDGGFGQAVLGGLNANGDGVADLVVGEPSYGAVDGRVALFTGNDLFLTASPTSVQGGDTLTLEAGLGSYGRQAAIYLVGIDGTPVFLPVLEGSFDFEGHLVFTGVVPPVVSGHTLTFHAFGYHWNGTLIDSSDVVVTIE